MKKFTEADVLYPDTEYPRINADAADLVDARPDWMKRGLQQTASGYGAKLMSGRKIHFEGRLYRLYVTQYSNVGSVWFEVRGRRIYVS